MFMSPKNSLAESVIPIMMVFGGEAFAKQLRDKGGGILIESMSLLKGRTKAFFFFFYKTGLSKSGRGLTPEPNHGGILILDSPHSRTVRNNFMLFKPPSLCFFLNAA